MSVIAAAGSSTSYNAIAQLLADGVSNTATPGSALQIGQAGNPASSASTSNSPTDSVDLSDRAKAVLAQAQKNQVAANELQALVQSNRNSTAGKGANVPGCRAASLDLDLDGRPVARRPRYHSRHSLD